MNDHIIHTRFSKGAFSNQVCMRNRKFSLGLLLDSLDVPAWEYSSIQRILQETSSEFVLVILNAGFSDSIEKEPKIYSIFNRIDQKLFTKKPDPFTPKNILELLPAVPVISVSPVQGYNISLLSESDLEMIRTYNLDILIKFGFGDLHLKNLNVAKYGTWFYYHGDDRIMKGGPPGFWEVVDNWTETGSALLASGGTLFSHRVLYRSHFLTYPLSPARHRSYYFWATTSFLSRQIYSLQQFGEEIFLKQTEQFNTALIREFKGYTAPSNLTTLKSIIKITWGLLKAVARRLFQKDHWFLMFSFSEDVSGNLGEFHNLVPPKDKFWADPHLIEVDGLYYLFMEEFVHTKKRGHISVIEMDEFGNWKAPVKILENDYHLSYPCVFQWNGKFYLVPESRANKTIDLYECVDFPYHWNFNHCIMENISAVDTTIIHYDGKWWLFTAIAENEAAAPNVELFLFFTDDIFSQNWIAHPQNPIVSDIKSARPAGSMFLKDGKLFRPSQDCSTDYGFGFDLNEVEVLTETDYQEKKIRSIRPHWNKEIQATHTYAKCNNLTVIDALKKSRRFV